MTELESKENGREIKFSSDEFELTGTLHMPEKGDEPPLVIGLHGLFSDSNSPKQLALAEALTEKSIAFFRFDHRGCGRSEGDFRTVTSFEGRCHDLIEAVNAIRRLGGIGHHIGLFGSSMGGSVCLSVARHIKATAVVTHAAASRSEPIQKHFDKGDHPDFNLERVDPLRLRFDLSEKIANLRNVLTFHGDSDTIIPPSEAHLIYNRCVMPKRLIMLRNGDHKLSLPENREKMLRETVSWFRASFKDSRIYGPI